ncbi:hypothetical protein HK101_009105 [Irineochytrium annulatum]|nr:hypothetical protein HK101_009105 [Irineochytrium annulatum]
MESTPLLHPNNGEHHARHASILAAYPVLSLIVLVSSALQTFQTFFCVVEHLSLASVLTSVAWIALTFATALVTAVRDPSDPRAPYFLAPLVPFHLSALAYSVILLIISVESSPEQNPTHVAVTLAGLVFSLTAFSSYLYLYNSVHSDLADAEEASLKADGRVTPSREVSASFFSRLYFSWVSPLVRLGYRRPLTEGDVPDLWEKDHATKAVETFRNFKSRFVNLGLRLFMLEYKLFFLQFVFSGTANMLAFSGPYFLYRIIGFIKDPSLYSPYDPYVCAMLLGVSTIVRALLDGHTWHAGRHVGIRVRSILINEIYAKGLKRVVINSGVDGKTGDEDLKEDANKDKKDKKDKKKKDEKKEEEEDDQGTVGKIVTLMSSDTEKIRDSCTFLFYAFTAPIQASVGIGALLVVVGWPALAGLSTMIATIPITSAWTKWSNRVMDDLMSRADKRTTVVNEVLQGIRIIKFFAWENNVMDKINAARKREMNSLIEYYFMNAVSVLIWSITPMLVSLVTFFSLTVLAGRTLDAQLAFTCVALFNSLRIPLLAFPEILMELFQLKVSIDRIDKFLRQPELEKYGAGSVAVDAVESSGSAGVPVVGFRAGWFQWYTEADKVDNKKEAKPAKKSFLSFTKSAKKDETTPLLAGAAEGDAVPASPASTASRPTAAFTLRGIELSFPIGGLTSVCGATGAGKSSLIQALLGEMKRLEGRAYLPDPRLRMALPIGSDGLDGGVAYVAQSSWLQNATIRDNITFGEPYDPIRYDRVIRACALVKDLATLEAGDLTEIGEKGINLSGGQKQRVSLARAVYSRASYVLLDDPLSAVDAPTARHLFDKAICGLLADRTRILVTHATSVALPFTDYLVVLQSGEVLAAGSVEDVVRVPGVESVFNIDIEGKGKGINGGSSAAGSEAGDDDDRAVAGSVPDYANGKTKEDARKLVETESSQTGAIKFNVYISYLAAAGGLTFTVASLLAVLFERGVLISSDYWVKVWADASGVGHPNDTVTALVGPRAGVEFGAFAVPRAAFALSSGTGADFSTKIEDKVDAVNGDGKLIVLAVYTIRCFGSYLASQKLHHALMVRILKAPMRFFDTTPIGRILNRATKDIATIDRQVIMNFQNVLDLSVDLLAITSVVTLITPMFFLTFLPVIMIHRWISIRYLTASRELKRLDSVTRSPIYAMFSETLVGASTIRAYGAEERFLAENLRRVDVNHRAYFYLWMSNRWLGVRISSVSAAVITIAAMSTVVSRNVIGAGLAGMSLTWALNFSDYLLWLIRCQAGLEMAMNAVERVDEYLEIDQEAPSVIESRRPAKSWPESGGLVVRDLEMRYAPELEPVLRGVSFEVIGGEKVGVVGRTGAGKSSLALALFRIVEPSAGSIHIDGVNCADVGLFDLRSRLTIIPQDPVLFNGTIRSNLDPFSEYDDEKIWASLGRVRFMETMQQAAAGALRRTDSGSTLVLTEDGEAAAADSIVVREGKGTTVTLDSAVSEGGGNFSQGQRQLLCLARALLKSSRLTILDEATASVDNETDARIQETIRGPDFDGTTVLSIAHRLRTIADYDKILVMDKGTVAQFGTPLELMQREGIFKNMCEESGEFADLLEMATKKAKGL